MNDIPQIVEKWLEWKNWIKSHWTCLFWQHFCQHLPTQNISVTNQSHGYASQPNKHLLMPVMLFSAYTLRLNNLKVWCGIIFSDFISVKFIFTAVSNPRSPSTLLHKPVQRRTYVSCLCKAHLKSCCGLILSGAQTPGRVWVSHLRALQKPTHKLQRGSWYSYTCDNMT